MPSATVNDQTSMPIGDQTSMSMNDLSIAEAKGTMTSESYTKMVEEIETEIKRVKAENNPEDKSKLTELKKEKRALKNKASAMRCREKKRRRMEILEQTVEDLNKKLLRLEQENAQLRAAAAASGASTPAPSAALVTPKSVPTPSPAPVAVPKTRVAAERKSLPLHRIHYSAPQKRRSSHIINVASAYSHPSGGLEKSPKMSHSRTHAVTTGTFPETDLDFSDVFASEDGSFGGAAAVANDADAFLNGDVLFWDEPNDDGKVLDAMDTFFQGHAGRSLVGAL